MTYAIGTLVVLVAGLGIQTGGPSALERFRFSCSRGRVAAGPCAGRGLPETFQPTTSATGSGRYTETEKAPNPADSARARLDRTMRVRTDAAALISAVPADAAVVVTVRDLASLDEKLKNLTEELELLPLSLLELAKGYLEIVTGIEDHGSAALLVMPADQSGSVARSMPMLLPTTDRADMLIFLNPEPAETGYSKVTLRGRASYVGTKGSFTVFGADLETVKSVVAAKSGWGSRLSPHQRKRLTENDLSIWVSAASLNSSPLTQTAPVQFLRSLGLCGERLQRLRAFQLSLRIQPDGIAVELYVTLTRSTPPTPARVSTESLLLGLPGESFILATGLAGDSAAALAAALGRMALAYAGQAGVIDPTRSDELREMIERNAAGVGQASVSVAALPEGPNGLIGLTKVIDFGDDPSGTDALRSDIDNYVRLLQSGVFIDPDLHRAMQKLSFRRAVETSGRVTIDHLQLDLSGFEAIDHAALIKAVGEDGLLLRIGVVDRKFAVVTFGGGKTRFDAVVADARAHRAPLSTHPAITACARNIAPGRYVEGYFALDRLIGLVRSVQRAMDLSSDLPALPELDTPIAWSIRSVGSDAASLDLFVPIRVVVALKEAAVGWVQTHRARSR